MICPATVNHEHQWTTPAPEKHLERCACCGIWRIHTEDKIVPLPPPEALAGLRREHPAAGRPGRLLRFSLGLEPNLVSIQV